LFAVGVNSIESESAQVTHSLEAAKISVYSALSRILVFDNNNSGLVHLVVVEYKSSSDHEMEATKNAFQLLHFNDVAHPALRVRFDPIGRFCG
jgi:hypothetical protein